MARLLSSILVSLFFLGCANTATNVENTLATQNVAGRKQVSNHAADGFYSIDMSIGNKVFHNILIDTGSANFIVFGDKNVCPTCLNPDLGNTSPNFTADTYTPTSSPLFNGEQFTIEYGDDRSSSTGQVRLYKDAIGFDVGGPTVDYELGVFTSGKQVQNVLGLGYAGLMRSVPDFTPLPFFDKFVVSNNLKNMFTMNLCPQGATGNFMTLGKLDDAISEGSIRYTTILPDNLLQQPAYDYYNVAPTTLSIEGTTVSSHFPTQSDRYFTIVDSGTFLLYLPQAMIADIATYYQTHLGIPTDFWSIPDDLNNIRLIDPQIQSQLGNINITFPNVSGGTFNVTITPQEYTLRARLDNGKTGLIALLRGVGPPVTTSGGFFPAVVVLGEVFMRSTYAVFDREKQQMGFAPNQALCATSSGSHASAQPLPQRLNHVLSVSPR